MNDLLRTAIGVLLLGGLAAGGIGCAGSEERVVRLSGDPIAGHSQTLPLSGARARLEAAKEHDVTLRIGFYAMPPATSGEELVRSLKGAVAPESWQAPGRDAYRDGNWLVVLQAPEVHQEIAGWAARERETIARNTELIQTEVRVFTLGKDADEVLERYGFSPIEPNGGSGPEVAADPARAVLYSTSGADLDGLFADSEIVTISAPRIMTYAGEKGSISITNRRAYVKDYEVYYLESAVVADPIIDTVADGLHVDLEASVIDHDRLEVDASVHVSKLHEMFEAEVLLDTNLDPVTIELPELSLRHITHRSALADGAALLFRGVRSGTPGHPDDLEPWILLRSERVRTQ